MAEIALYDNLPDALNHIKVQDKAMKNLLLHLKNLKDNISLREQEIANLKAEIEDLEFHIDETKDY